MLLTPALWIYTGDKTDLVVFRRRFKIQRIRTSPLVRRVADEQCFGVLCYEQSDHYNPITEIVPPVLSLRWAQQAINLLETRFPNATVAQWEELENALRRIGYTGPPLCSFSLADAVGFAVLEKSGEYTTAELESLPEGEIEKYLSGRGFYWRGDLRTWQTSEGDLWQREERRWQEIGAPQFTGTNSRSRAIMLVSCHNYGSSPRS